MSLQNRPHLFGLVAGLFLAAGLCLAALLVTRAWMRINESQIVSVTGSARKDVRSDLALWDCSFFSEAPTLAEAHALSKEDLAKVELFLRGAGQTDFVVLPITVNELSRRVKTPDGGETHQHAGYRIRQSLKVRSTQVESLPALASASAAMLSQGVSLSSDNLSFIYTKANDAKIEMMAEATRDARARAEQIASNGGRGIRELRSARMGVVQINPLYSTATSWEGNNDTGSLEKTITCTVSATFTLD
jgi:hypothetical protein